MARPSRSNPLRATFPAEARFAPGRGDRARHGRKPSQGPLQRSSSRARGPMAGEGPSRDGRPQSSDQPCERTLATGRRSCRPGCRLQPCYRIPSSRFPAGLCLRHRGPSQVRDHGASGVPVGSFRDIRTHGNPTRRSRSGRPKAPDRPDASRLYGGHQCRCWC